VTGIEDECILQQFAKVFICLFLLGSFPCERGDHNAGARRECVEGFLEFQVVALHDELEDVTALIALTEAAPRTRLRPDHKRWGFLVIVERAKTGIVLAGVPQFYPCFRNKIHDIYASFNFIDYGHKVCEL
jgi:hypothetical protein